MRNWMPYNVYFVLHFGNSNVDYSNQMFRKRKTNENKQIWKTKKMHEKRRNFLYEINTAYEMNVQGLINATNTNTMLLCDEIAQKNSLEWYIVVLNVCGAFSLFILSVQFILLFFLRKKIVLFFVILSTNTSIQCRRDWTFGMRLYAWCLCVLVGYMN